MDDEIIDKTNEIVSKLLALMGEKAEIKCMA